MCGSLSGLRCGGGFATHIADRALWGSPPTTCAPERRSACNHLNKNATFYFLKDEKKMNRQYDVGMGGERVFVGVRVGLCECWWVFVWVCGVGGVSCRRSSILFISVVCSCRVSSCRLSFFSSCRYAPWVTPQRSN